MKRIAVLLLLAANLFGILSCGKYAGENAILDRTTIAFEAKSTFTDDKNNWEVSRIVIDSTASGHDYRDISYWHNKVWVIDSKHARIHQFDFDQDFILKRSEPIQLPELKSPYLLYSNSEYMYVLDIEQNLILKYNLALELVDKIMLEAIRGIQIAEILSFVVSDDETYLTISSYHQHQSGLYRIRANRCEKLKEGVIGYLSMGEQDLYLTNSYFNHVEEGRHYIQSGKSKIFVFKPEDKNKIELSLYSINERLVPLKIFTYGDLLYSVSRGNNSIVAYDLEGSNSYAIFSLERVQGDPLQIGAMAMNLNGDFFLLEHTRGELYWIRKESNQ